MGSYREMFKLHYKDKLGEINGVKTVIFDKAVIGNVRILSLPLSASVEFPGVFTSG